jgi:hypothetical protein
MLSPLSIYGDSGKMKLPLLHNTRIHAPEGTLEILVVAPSDGCLVTAPCLASTQALRPRHVSSASKLLSRLDPVSTHRASGLGYVVQPCNLASFVVNRRKPRVHTPVMSHYPTPTPVHDFVLLFLPPCGAHLTPLATGSLEPSLLVSPLLGGPARHRPFTFALHLHQRKSNHNWHLQYSAKSLSTPRCQSLITARSNQPPFLRRSSPQSPP